MNQKLKIKTKREISPKFSDDLLHQLESENFQNIRLIQTILQIIQQLRKKTSDKRMQFLCKVMRKFTFFQKFEYTYGEQAYCELITELNYQKIEEKTTVSNLTTQKVYIFFQGLCYKIQKQLDQYDGPYNLDFLFMTYYKQHKVSNLLSGDSFSSCDVNNLYFTFEKEAEFIYIEQNAYERITEQGLIFQKYKRQFGQELIDSQEIKDKLKFFQQIQLINILQFDDLRLLCQKTIQQEYYKQQVIYKEKDQPEYTYFILSGQIILVKQNNLETQVKNLDEQKYLSDMFIPTYQQHTIVSTLSENQMFGYEESFLNQNRQLTAYCQSSTAQILQIPSSEFMKLFDGVIK